MPENGKQLKLKNDQPVDAVLGVVEVEEAVVAVVGVTSRVHASTALEWSMPSTHHTAATPAYLVTFMTG
eukprot:1086763-Amphidinium_carterae.1